MSYKKISSSQRTMSAVKKPSVFRQSEIKDLRKTRSVYEYMRILSGFFRLRLPKNGRFVSVGSSCKTILLSVAFSCLSLSGYALADDTVTRNDSSLEQCKQIAEMTPLDIFSQTQEGVNATYDTLAQNCFTQNACSSLTDVDKPICARSLALNSYLIHVAYNTQGPAYPPYSNELPDQSVEKTSQNPEIEKNPAYNNLAAPSLIPETQTTNDSKEATIKWS
jgi:hypothetical protein